MELFNETKENFLYVLKNKYIAFEGRASRREYWLFFLANLSISILFSIVQNILGMGRNGSGPLSSLFSLALMLPSFGISFRRLHDVNRSAWWLLLSFVPLVGWLVLLYWAVQKGDKGSNDFGPAPKK